MVFSTTDTHTGVNFNLLIDMYASIYVCWLFSTLIIVIISFLEFFLLLKTGRQNSKEGDTKKEITRKNSFKVDPILGFLTNPSCMSGRCKLQRIKKDGILFFLLLLCRAWKFGKEEERQREKQTDRLSFPSRLSFCSLHQDEGDVRSDIFAIVQNDSFFSKGDDIRMKLG